MAEKLRSGSSKWGDMDDLISVGDAFTEAEDDSDFVGEDQTSLLGDRSWLPDYDFEAADTKYREAPKGTVGAKSQEKVIIFAFFKDTLSYLQAAP